MKYGKLVLGTMALLAMGLAHAQQSFDLTFSTSAGISGNLILTGTEIGTTGEYFITNATGEINSNSVSLLATGSNLWNSPSTTNGHQNYVTGNWYYDNVLYTGASASFNGGAPFDLAGLGLKSGGQGMNLYSINGQYVFGDDHLYNGGVNYVPANVIGGAVSAVPEMTTYLQLLLGLTLVASLAVRRHAQAAQRTVRA